MNKKDISKLIGALIEVTFEIICGISLAWLFIGFIIGG